jgi:hypothetical protein
VECELTREFGVEWIARVDGRGNEIKGISQAQMDAYSTRTVQVREKERELARAWERMHGRARAAVHRQRRHSAVAQGQRAGAVSDVRGPGAEPGEHHAGRRRASPSRRHPSWPPSLPRSTSLSWPPDI